MKAFLSVITPAARDTLCMHVFTIECDAGLDWVKAHADELAGRILPGAPYIALNVTQEDPV